MSSILYKISNFCEIVYLMAVKLKKESSPSFCSNSFF